MSTVQHLLPQRERYFKANLHTHSTISDGSMTPQELKIAYKAKGYSILSLTDHNVVVDQSALNEEDFLMLTGAEYNINDTDTSPDFRYYKTCHLNCIAKKPGTLWQPFPGPENAKEWTDKAQVENLPRVYTTEAINAIIARANETGHLVMYNHPVWSLQDYTDYAGLKGLWGMELCNYSCLTAGYYDRDNSMVYRDLVNLNGRIFPLGADDSHSTRDLGGAWIMVGAEKLEYASVIDALEKGDFYASTGPEIYGLSLEGNTLRVRCSDARQVTVECGNRYALTSRNTGNDGLLREVEFDLTPWLDMCRGGNLDWFRVVVHGPYGHYAATRAYHRAELKK